MDLQSLRVLWLAGRRGEILLLGPLFQRMARTTGFKPTSWFLASGEDGTAAYQAFDFLGLRADETGALCHPADQPAVRLTLLLERIETFMRQRKGQRLIFTGYGPAAAAAAICCHARGNPGLWLRPADPAGLTARLRWEAGLARIIEACAPAVSIVDLDPMPDLTKLAAAAGRVVECDLTREISGLRPDAPRMIWGVLRRDWGMFGNTGSQMINALARSAAERPEIDFVILSNLNAVLERPLASMKNRPSNLLITPPLPYTVYTQLLKSSAGVITDSSLIAAEAIREGKPFAAIGEQNGEKDSDFIPDELPQKLGEWIGKSLGVPPSGGIESNPEAWLDRVQQAVSEWLCGSECE